MAVKLAQPLKQLLKASFLGGNKNHPLAGWHILTMLYHDGGSRDPLTLNYLLDRYNQDYLDANERPLRDEVLKKIMYVLSDQARLVDVAPRKIRLQMLNGGGHLQQSAVYRITSSGIEYLTMMQKVVDAESTVTANITRINEFCELVHTLTRPPHDLTSTRLYNDFQNMVAANSDVMKGMHKLDEDLDELTNSLVFDHGSVAATHLAKMLNDQAMPAFNQLMKQGARIGALLHSPRFSDQVAASQQGSDNLDIARAIGNQTALTIRHQRTQRYVQTKLQQLALSFSASTSDIDSSLDSLYLLFQTIMTANQRLSQEYDAIQNQTVDAQQLTMQIDHLLDHYQSVVINGSIPRHLALDRDLEDVTDFLEATTMGPVKYAAVAPARVIVTAADNPEVAVDEALATENVAASLNEFRQLIMREANHGVVDHDLTFNSRLARDEVVRLASAPGYRHLESFAPFGRPIISAQVLVRTPRISLQLVGETFRVWLPQGFEIWFAKESQDE